jgi:hypothetical protein
VSATSVTGSIRAIIARRDERQLGGLAGEALAVGDGQQVGAELVDLASSPAWLEEERPSTATIAATPIAIPSAESAARSRRVRSPTLATRARSEAKRGEVASPAAFVVAVACAEPPTKLAPAPAAPEAPELPAPEPSAKVTVAYGSGSPFEPSTLTRSGLR